MSNTTLSVLSARIRAARVQSRLSQKELGDSIGVSDKSISSYEKGRSIPTLDTLKKISKATQYPIHYFTDEQEATHASLAQRLGHIEKEISALKKLLKGS